jgi:putative nucleotidyltransferase with HDIG domain
VKGRSNPPVDVVPAAIEEELWFGGHDASVAEDAAARSMAALVGRIVGAKPFPESARKLAELTRKDVIRIEPIVQVLERDPALSARLLRLVNSAGYALRQRCTSVRHAATLVGTDRLHQIATTAAVLDLFDARGSIAARIIEHSTIVGAFCRYFGAHLALPVDDLFTAGFLHDIGKLMLLETEGDQYVELLEKYADRPDAIHVVERSLYGFDHAVLGAHVLTAWNIPDPVPKIVAWHHDPTRAYRVSSMMAALVQTVRLADLAVYAMVGGADQAQISTLASTEAASYLDISEPQLSSMWDELQTLYRESVEQCRGENAPALDPRSLRPKQPLSVSLHPDAPRSTELPLQFPCVVCGRPTFGNTCSACNGHMCPEHQEGREDWCTLCARDYRTVNEESPQAMSMRLAIVVALATFSISVAFGYETGGLAGALRAGIGTILLILLAVLLAITTRRLLLRFRFVRSRPDRALHEAQENDGGMLSIAPPFSDPVHGGPMSHRDPLTEQLRMSGAAIERVKIREVGSLPAIIAPKPFEGLTEAVPPSSRHVDPKFPGQAGPSREPQAANSQLSEEADRLARQSRSLVTLPVPSQPTAEQLRKDAPLRPSESIDIDGEDRISELGLNGLDPTPPSDPTELSPSAVRGHPAARPAVERSSSRSGTFPSRPPLARSDEQCSQGEMAVAPLVSEHPLAALGIHPEKSEGTARRGCEAAPSTAPATEPSTSHQPTAVQSVRQTLHGISADDLARAWAAPKPPDPALMPEHVAKEPAPRATFDDSLDVPADAILDDSLDLQAAQEWAVLPTAPEPPLAAAAESPEPPLAAAAGSPEPPLAAAAESPEPPLAAAAGSPEPPLTTPFPRETNQDFETSLIATLGPEFQAKVMELVAERVAARVAERMLADFAQPTRASAPRKRAVKNLPSSTPQAEPKPKAKPRRRKAQSK